MINLPDIKPQPLGCEVYKGMALKEVRESLLNFLVEGLDGDIAKDTKELFSNAELFVFGGVLVVYWTTHITDEYEFKNGAWVLVGSNSPEYKKPIEIFMETQNEPNKDMFPSTCSPAPLNIDAPFYQGMTKEETYQSLNHFRMGNGRAELQAESIVVYEDYLIVKVSGILRDGFYQYIYQKDKSDWCLISSNLLVLKAVSLEDVFESQKLKQEEKAVFEEHKRQRDKVGGKVCELVADKMEKEAKELLGKVDDDIINSLDKSGEDADSLNDGILAKGYKKKVQPKPELTAQDLIQAAKDELVDRTADLHVTCSIDPEKQPTINVGFAQCIKFLEQTIGKDPYKN